MCSLVVVRARLRASDHATTRSQSDMSRCRRSRNAMVMENISLAALFRPECAGIQMRYLSHMPQGAAGQPSMVDGKVGGKVTKVGSSQAGGDCNGGEGKG